MDKLVEHGIRMLEIVEGENDFFRNDAKRQADIAQAVYDTILRVQALERKADRKTEPTISKMEQVDKDINVRSKDEPQKRCDECIHFDKTYKKRDKYGMLIIGVECDGMDEPCDKWTDEPQTERSNDEE